MRGVWDSPSTRGTVRYDRRRWTKGKAGPGAGCPGGAVRWGRVRRELLRRAGRGQADRTTSVGRAAVANHRCHADGAVGVRYTAPARRDPTGPPRGRIRLPVRWSPRLRAFDARAAGIGSRRDPLARGGAGAVWRPRLVRERW